MIGMIKWKIGSDGRNYLKTGLRKRKKYSNEKAELCLDELFHYLLDKENTEKKAKDCSFYLEINLFKKLICTWGINISGFIGIFRFPLTSIAQNFALFYREFDEGLHLLEGIPRRVPIKVD